MRSTFGILVTAVCTLSLMGCSGSKLLPSETSASSATFQTYDQMEGAYDAVMPGKTTTAELAKIGFDVKAAPNLEILTYVGVIDRLPQDARAAGHLPQPVQDCIAAQDRCVAYVFRPEHFESRHVGNPLLELGGFQHKTIESGWSAEVVLLIQDERVVYKLMSGKPRTEDTKTSTQPLGPLQNLGERVGGSRPEGNQ